MKRIKLFWIYIILSLFNIGCMKEFLEIKREKSQVIPSKLEDYLALLDYNLNYNFPSQLSEIGSDDYYVLDEQWSSLTSPVHKNAYIWAKEVYEGEEGYDWNRGYEKILIANFVLEGVEKMEETPQNKILRDETLGSAHFYRGTIFFMLAQIYCEQYNSQLSNQLLGLPLRETSNINVRYQRSNLEETYSLIIEDLSQAINLLPQETLVNTRPNRKAALAMLSNVYLQKGEYNLALKYADEALKSGATIIDYNQINTSVNSPFPLYGQGNSEILFYSHTTCPQILGTARLIVDSTLYNSYEDSDLRKVTFFRLLNGNYTFKGHYSGIVAFLFTGVTTTETLMVRAECKVRLNDLVGAREDLNLLRSNRIMKEAFIPIDSKISKEDLLIKILNERRKELVFRGKRWFDLKRFSLDNKMSKSLERNIDGIIYTLPIGDNRWVWPIPPEAIQLGELEQNKR